ncbi:MAG TPA: AMP-binding protein [Candidatus Dormibacteraeota bacterium]
MSASGTPTTRSYAWRPTADQVERSRLRSFMTKLGVDDMEALNGLAQRDPERFWSATIDDIGISWEQRPTRMRDTSEGLPFTRWWSGGRLNLATNAADRWARIQPDRDAVVWEGDDGAERVWSYGELAAQTARCANGLRELGIGPGDGVGLCLPMIPETVAVFLACSKVGAMVIPLFSGYGAGAIVARLQDCEAKVLVIADGFPRRGSPVPMKPVADEVAEQTPSLRHVIVVRRLGTVAVRMQPHRDVWYDELTATQPATAETTDSSAGDTFMLIYTSGTTGRPKGTVHVQGGFPIKATQDMAHCFDVGPDDRLLWFTDIGWMMGPWAICGTLSIGASLVLFEGVPDHPGPDRLWSVVSRHRVTVLGVAPTVVRALMRHGDEPAHAHDLSSLRVLGSSGEPWNVDPWQWFLDHIGGGRCPIINYSGGTEVSGGIVAGNMLTPLNPCAFAGPCPGMDADVLDENGNSVRGQVGELVVRSPWPGMTRGFWHDRERYLETYWSRWPDVWVHGDWAQIAEDGLWYIRGRSDDTIKLAGKRLGPAEVESALVADPGVAEAAAVGIPDAVKGEALVCFVVLKPGVDDSVELRAALSDRVSAEMGKALRPKAVLVIAELPKTRNAKVIRRIVRAVYLGNDPGDLSSLENPAAIEALEAARAIH